MKDLRIAHIADTHLGYRTASVAGRDEDFSRSWITACRAIVDSSPDLILHAGDVFHNSQPSWGAVSSFLEGAYILQEANVPILIISGNHDSPRLRMKHTAFSVLSTAVPKIVIANEEEPILVSPVDLPVDVVLMPHRSLTSPLLLERLEALLPPFVEDRYSIMVAHGDIRAITRGPDNEHGAIAIPESLFSYPWSYIALGHLHMAQPFGQNGWYSGSIERCGWSDYPALPAWTVTTLSPRGIRHTQQDLPHRRMVLLDPVDCTNASDFAILAEIRNGVDRSRIGDPPTLVRIVLGGISTHRVYTIERTAREDLKKVHPNAHLTVGHKKTEELKVQRELNPIREYGKLNVEDMFEMFMVGREYPRETEGFRERMLARGREALQEVRQAEHEADMGDERSVSVG